MKHALALTGLSHEKAPSDVRERFHLTRRQALETMHEIRRSGQIDEILILSTCNRTEIYAVGEDSDAVRQVLGDYFTRQDASVTDYLYAKQDDEALAHLFSVASGFDSMILGEDQILGQTKDALALANASGNAGKFLNRAVQQAIHYAKTVKSRYKVSDSPRSLASTAIKRLMREVPDCQLKKVLIVGAGNIGRLSLRYMACEGFEHVVMTNRTYHTGDEFRDLYPDLRTIPYEARYKAAKDADIIICATASPHLVLREADYPETDHPQWLIDLALPRDIDPALGKRDAVTLYEIDDFRGMIDEADEKIHGLKDKIAAEIDECVRDFSAWASREGADALSGELLGMAMERADETIEILTRRLDPGEKDLKFMKKIIRSEFRKLVLPAILEMKEMDEAELLAVENAFDLLTGRDEACDAPADD